MGRAQARLGATATASARGQLTVSIRDEVQRLLATRPNLAAGLQQLPDGCSQFIHDYQDAFLTAPGSGAKHQAWAGGYADHLDELFALTAVQYETLSRLRPLPFTPQDALLVLFLHDSEKVFKRHQEPMSATYRELGAADPHVLQQRICEDYGLSLTAEQQNALTYVHGELDDYQRDRVAGRLAAFVHMCDYWSARGWYDEPARSGPLPSLLPQRENT